MTRITSNWRQLKEENKEAYVNRYMPKFAIKDRYGNVTLTNITYRFAVELTTKSNSHFVGQDTSTIWFI